MREGVAESLPWDDGAFDAALCALVVAWMSDADQGIGEMARVTKPGGTVAAAMWDIPGGGLQMLSYFWRAALAIDPTVADEPPRAGVREGDLVERFGRGGLRAYTGGTLDDVELRRLRGLLGAVRRRRWSRHGRLLRLARRCRQGDPARHRARLPCPRARSRCRPTPGSRWEPFRTRQIFAKRGLRVAA